MSAMRILIISTLFLITPSLWATELEPKPSQLTPDGLLDAIHHYAAEADWDNYFELYLKKGIFIGTDASEHWDKQTFSNYARPTKGWRYKPTQRKLTQHGNVIVFDELLVNSSYGECRGTGTLIKTRAGWKVAQYHLSFPIPNEIAKEITQKIKAYQTHE